MKGGRKVKASEWLASDEEEPKQEVRKVKPAHNEFLDDDEEGQDDITRFEKGDFEDEKKGRLMFELQKSFGGDKRFKLDAR